MEKYQEKSKQQTVEVFIFEIEQREQGTVVEEILLKSLRLKNMEHL